MVETVTVEPFAEYADLLHERLLLEAETAAAGSLLQEEADSAIAVVDRRIATLLAEPALDQGAVRYGADLARQAKESLADGMMVPADKVQEREALACRLRQVAAFVLERNIDDDGLHDMQEALGLLGAMAMRRELALYGGAEVPPLQLFDPDEALMRLRAQLLALAPGERLRLSPQQLLDMAAPNVAISRWQRYRFIQRARKVLQGAGHMFEHNGKRGTASRYVLDGGVVQSAWLPIAV